MSAPATSHIRGLDGLRAFAVMAVLAYHLGYLRGGFLGVDLFFVLSGFLITSLLLRRADSGIAGLRPWWIARFTRLTPAAVVVVLFVLVAFSTLAGVTMDAVATLTWWQNWHLILQQTSYWATDASPLRHAWSLSIEEQFYLIWPLLLMASTRLAARLDRSARHTVALVAGTLGLASFGWAAYLATTGADLSRIYFGTDTRAGGLLLGCVLGALIGTRPHRQDQARQNRSLPTDSTSTDSAPTDPVPVGGAPGEPVAAPVVRRRRVDRPSPAQRRTARILDLGSPVAAIVLVVSAFTLAPEQRFTYLGGLAIASVSAAWLVVAASRATTLARWCSAGVLVWLGTRSYAIYLWSWPIQLFVLERMPDTSEWITTPLIVGAAILLAHLSLLLVETPLRRGDGWATELRPRRRAWVAGSILVIIAMAFATLRTEDAPAFEQVTSAEAAEEALKAPTTTEPAPQVEDRPMSVMLAGDSLAFATGFVTSAEDLALADVGSMDLRGFIGCGALASAGWSVLGPDGEPVPWPDECPDQREAERLGLTAQPDWEILFAGGWEMHSYRGPDGVDHEPMDPAVGAAVEQELVQRGAEAAAAGTRIAYVSWVCPGADSDQPRIDGYASWINSIMENAAERTPGAVVIETTDRVCIDGDPDGLPTEEKDEAWNHEHHPSDTAWLWGVWLGPQLEAANADGRSADGS